MTTYKLVPATDVPNGVRRARFGSESHAQEAVKALNAATRGEDSLAWTHERSATGFWSIIVEGPLRRWALKDGDCFQYLEGLHPETKRIVGKRGDYIPSGWKVSSKYLAKKGGRWEMTVMCIPHWYDKPLRRCDLKEGDCFRYLDYKRHMNIIVSEACPSDRPNLWGWSNQQGAVGKGLWQEPVIRVPHWNEKPTTTCADWVPYDYLDQTQPGVGMTNRTLLERYTAAQRSEKIVTTDNGKATPDLTPREFTTAMRVWTHVVKQRAKDAADKEHNRVVYDGDDLPNWKDAL